MTEPTEDTGLPYPEIPPFGDNKPPAVPSLWNSRWRAITENFLYLMERAGKAIQFTSKTGAAIITKGTSEQRGLPEEGHFRFNTDTRRFEGGNGDAWGSLGGATGGGNDAVFYENEKVIRSPYVLNTHAVSAGGIEIAEGGSVEITPGNGWSVL